MKKLRYLFFLMLAVLSLSITASALEFRDLTIDSESIFEMDYEISEVTSPLTANQPETVSTQSMERTQNVYVYPYDTTTGAAFVRNTVARLDFIVAGYDSKLSFSATLVDENLKSFVSFETPLSKINTASSNEHAVYLKIDLKKYQVPLGDHYLLYSIIDQNQEPVDEGVVLFSVVDREKPLTSVSFYNADSENADAVTALSLCPEQDILLGLDYTPLHATGHRSVTYTSSNQNIFTVSSYAGYAYLVPAAAGTATLTATVNDTVTASISVTVGHDLVLKETLTQPTCTQNGKAIYECSRCGEQTEKTLAANHDFGSNPVTVVTAPRACTPGESKQHCDRCNQDITYSVPAIFSDTVATEYYAEPVNYFYSTGIVKGMEDTFFGTDTALTRGMLLAFLYRMAGEPTGTYSSPFTDVDSKEYYATPIAWGYYNKIVVGVTDTTFQPNANVTREQLVSFLYRYAQYRKTDVSATTDIQTFPDATKVLDYAKPGMSWAVATKIVYGSSNPDGSITLEPAGNATRAQAVTMLYRYLSYESSHPVVDNDGAVG